FDHRGGVPGRSRAGDDGATGPHRRHAGVEAAAPAQPRRDGDRGLRRAHAAHPRGAERRRRHRMKSSATNFLLRLLLIVAFLALWEAVVRVFSIPLFILPAPSAVFMALYRGIA